MESLSGDPVMREAVENQIRHFGQTPSQVRTMIHEYINQTINLHLKSIFNISLHSYAYLFKHSYWWSHILLDLQQCICHQWCFHQCLMMCAWSWSFFQTHRFAILRQIRSHNYHFLLLSQLLQINILQWTDGTQIIQVCCSTYFFIITISF